VATWSVTAKAHSRCKKGADEDPHPDATLAARAARVKRDGPLQSSAVVTATKIKLGDTEVARIGLGTNRLTHTPEGTAFLRDAIEAGIDHVDTAHLYTGGQSEATIGDGLSQGVRPGVVVATKGGYNEATPEVLRRELQESLRRLGTESVELYYLHRVQPETPLEESLGAIAEEREAGRIRHVGISEVSVEQIERARELVPIAAVQNRYSLSDRDHDDVVDYCTEQQIPFVPFFPLRGAGGRELTEIAERRGATSHQIALAWLLGRSPMMLPIPGTLSVEHARENLGALEIELTDAERDALG
jgi:pyridoxine 4-dehydrogenase